MNYEIIPQDIRVLINNQYPQINDNHKNQLTELWSVLLQIGGNNEQTIPQFLAFLQQQIGNENDAQTISDRIDAEITQMEGLTGGKRKRKRKRKSSKKKKKSYKKSFKKRNKKSYKKRK